MSNLITENIKLNDDKPTRKIIDLNLIIENKECEIVSLNAEREEVENSLCNITKLYFETQQKIKLEQEEYDKGISENKKALRDESDRLRLGNEKLLEEQENCQKMLLEINSLIEKNTNIINSAKIIIVELQNKIDEFTDEHNKLVEEKENLNNLDKKVKINVDKLASDTKDFKEYCENKSAEISSKYQELTIFGNNLQSIELNLKTSNRIMLEKEIKLRDKEDQLKQIVSRLKKQGINI